MNCFFYEKNMYIYEYIGSPACKPVPWLDRIHKFLPCYDENLEKHGGLGFVPVVPLLCRTVIINNIIMDKSRHRGAPA